MMWKPFCKQMSFIPSLLLHDDITYLPHKAVAEVSKDKEPIGRERAEFNWFESQLMSDSNDLRVKWFGCQSMCASNDFGCQLIWDSSDLVVIWFEIQVIRLSIHLRFKWFGCQSIWDSNELVANWFEIQVIWLSTDAWFKWFCPTKLFCETSFKNEALKINKWSFSARLPSKLKLWNSKTKHFCETSFKNEALKIKNEAFLRDFLQKWNFEAQNEAFLRDFLQKRSFEAQKRSFPAKLPSKMTLWRSKMKHFCETSFKNEALKIKNEAFLRDFLQKWHVDQALDLRIPIRFNDFYVNASKVLRLPRKSWAKAYEVL